MVHKMQFLRIVPQVHTRLALLRDYEPKKKARSGRAFQICNVRLTRL